MIWSGELNIHGEMNTWNFYRIIYLQDQENIKLAEMMMNKKKPDKIRS